MWDFSGDEWVAFVLAAAGTIIGVGLYYRPVFSIPVRRGSAWGRLVLGLFPPLALFPACLSLQNWADSRVTGHLDYIALFLLVGAASILILRKVFGVFGISLRDDVLDRDNPAALIVVCGTMLAIGIVYAGANVGRGPTIWTTLLPAFAGMFALGAIRLFVELAGGRIFESITIDRDISSGWRLAGMMVGCAILLGRAAGGNWVSWPQTWDDFVRFGWPVILIALAATILHHTLRPTAARPSPRVNLCGILPASVFLLAGLGWVVLRLNGLHPWEW
jgi:hypothetical protein